MTKTQMTKTINLLGILYIYMDKNTYALEAYYKALEIHSTSPRVLYNLGLLLLKERNYERAIHHFKKLVDIDPSCKNARVGLEILEK